MPIADVDIRIDLKRGLGVQRIAVYSDDAAEREMGLRALLSITEETAPDRR